MGLSPDVRRKADKAYALWSGNHHHPSLHFKKVGKYWSVRIDDDFRAVGELRGDTVYWLWIGDHESYEALISGGR